MICGTSKNFDFSIKDSEPDVRETLGATKNLLCSKSPPSSYNLGSKTALRTKAITTRATHLHARELRWSPKNLKCLRFGMSIWDSTLTSQKPNHSKQVFHLKHNIAPKSHISNQFKTSCSSTIPSLKSSPTEKGNTKLKIKENKIGLTQSNTSNLNYLKLQGKFSLMHIQIGNTYIHNTYKTLQFKHSSHPRLYRNSKHNK